MTITNLSEFESGIERDMQLPEDVTGEVVQKAAIQALRGLVLGTPVDTGRARANWNVATGEADLSTTEDTGWESKLNEGTARIANANPYSVIWLSNALDYIMPLEQGHSQQAPTGWVESTLRRVEDQFDDL